MTPEKVEALKQRIEVNLSKLVINVSSAIKKPTNTVEVQTADNAEPTGNTIYFKSPLLKRIHIAQDDTEYQSHREDDA
jgi:hypothetical protein